MRRGDRSHARLPVRAADRAPGTALANASEGEHGRPREEASAQASDEEIAEATIGVLREHVPSEVPGILFLSGGMSDEQATSRLNEMNRRGGLPWELSFSYGRALQAPSLAAWGGDPSRVEAGQRALAHRARMNGLARSGEYSPDLERAA